MKRRGGFRKGTRQTLRKNPRERGKICISRIIQKFEVGDKAAIVLEPSYHFGMPHSRFKGKIVTIIGKQGDCYIGLFKDGNKEKKVIVHPVHLKKFEKQ